MPDELNVALLERAHEDGAVYGSKAVGEPPLMLAFSVREALRQAAAAFGPPGTSVDLASPATPEAVFWALERPAAPTTWSTGCRARPDRRTRRAALTRLRAERDVQLAERRRAAPRGARGGRAGHRRRRPRARAARRRRQDGRRGRATTWGSVGGGNLEETAVARARAMLDGVRRRAGAARPSGSPTRPAPSTAASAAAARSPSCSSRCPSCPSVAIFGVGHVGLELARILAGHDLDLHLVDSRADQLADDRLALPRRRRGRASTSTTSPVPELALGAVPARHPRAGDDPRPRRGLRALRRRAALHPPRHASG